MLYPRLVYFPKTIIVQDNAIKNRCRVIERNPGKEKRSCSKMKPQVVDISCDIELIDGVGYSHIGHEHCHYEWHYNYHPVSSAVAPMDLHQHCDHEVEQASENDFSVDAEDNNPNTDIIKTEAKIGWFEDGWVDDIIQIAQSDFLNEEKASETMMVTPSRAPTIPMLMMDPSLNTLFHSMFSRFNVNYLTLDINNHMPIGSTTPINSSCTVSYQQYSV